MACVVQCILCSLFYISSLYLLIPNPYIAPPTVNHWFSVSLLLYYILQFVVFFRIPHIRYTVSSLTYFI